MLEIEKTYLIKQLPKNFNRRNFIEITDKYLPANSIHPKIRLRKMGDKMELTKKTPQNTAKSIQNEETIKLSPEEYKSFEKIKGKSLKKRRYIYKHRNNIVEIDIYLGDLAGLAIADVEFKGNRQLSTFRKPDFCLKDITSNDVFAAGMLAGKKYSQLKKYLQKFKYKKILL